ncbi:MAG: pyridoxamine 5'-phosphate oxidase family protein [Sphingomonadales bacterium]
MSKKEVTDRIKVRRLPERGRYERDEIYPIVDAAILCHVGFSIDSQPYVIPMGFARDGDSLYLHGPTRGRIMKHLKSGASACVTISHLDGLVLAKSQFHHSMNYRTAILFGTCTEIADPREKSDGLNKLVAHLAQGQENYARAGNAQELKATTLLRFEIEEASAKIRTGPPSDAVEDLKLDIWSGVIPLALGAGEIIPDPVDSPEKEIPAHVFELYEKLKG